MFSMRHGATALLVSAALLSGCAHLASHPLIAADQAAVKSADIVGLVPQKEVDAEIVVQNSGAATAQFGLIGALIGSAIDAGINAHRASTAEETVRPLRDALLGYDFDSQLKQDLQHELGQVAWLGASSVTISKDGSDQARSSTVLSSTNGVLFVQTAYALSPDFSKLRVTAATSLFRKPAPAPRGETLEEHNRRLAASADRSNALYYDTVVVETPLEAPATDLEQNRAKWAENNGDRLRRSLQFQVTELARLIAQDLQYAAPEHPAKEDQVVESSDKLKVVRKVDGTLSATVTLASLPPLQPVVAAQPAPATTPVAAPSDAAAPAQPAAPSPAVAAPSAVAAPAAAAASPTAVSAAPAATAAPAIAPAN